MEKICLYILADHYNHEIYKTAFKNKNDAVCCLKTLSEKFTLWKTLPIFDHTDTKAYYVSYSYSEELNGDKEIFGVSCSIHISPSKTILYVSDLCLKEITSDNIVYKTNDLNNVTIRDDDGYYHFCIKSIDIV